MRKPWLASGPLTVLYLGIATLASAQADVYQLEGLAPPPPNQLALMVDLGVVRVVKSEGAVNAVVGAVKSVDGRRLVKTRAAKDTYSSALMPASAARHVLDVTEIAPGPHTLLIDISERFPGGQLSAAPRTVAWEAVVGRIYAVRVSEGKASKGRFSWDAWLEDVTDTRDPPCVADPDQNHPRGRPKVDGKYMVCFPNNPGKRVSQ